MAVESWADVGRPDLTWLPPDDAVDHGTVDLAAQTRKLRVPGRRSLVLTVLWLVVAAGVFAGLSAVGRPSGELLRDGVRVTGKVLDAADRPRTIHFSYAVPGELRFATPAPPARTTGVGGRFGPGHGRPLPDRPPAATALRRMAERG